MSYFRGFGRHHRINPLLNPDGSPRDFKPQVIDFEPRRFKGPPHEHYYTIIWYKFPLSEEKTLSLYNSVASVMYILDKNRSLFLFENLSPDEFPNFHPANNRSCAYGYRAADLPSFESILEPYIPSLPR